MRQSESDWLATLPVPRGSAAARAVPWGLLAAALTMLVVTVFRGLQFTPTGASNRLVDYSIAIIVLPIAAVAVCAFWAFLRLALLACWPTTVGVIATRHELILRFGPFGTTRLDANRFDIRYPYEVAEDDVDDGYEALLPEDVQRAQLCPRIVHPHATQRLDLWLARRTGFTPQEIAVRLRPAIEYYRNLRSPGEDI